MRIVIDRGAFQINTANRFVLPLLLNIVQEQ